MTSGARSRRFDDRGVARDLLLHCGQVVKHLAAFLLALRADFAGGGWGRLRSAVGADRLPVMTVGSAPVADGGAQRRARIAAAAVGLLASSGLRALTHRAVDAAAGMTPGSVNYHAPTRKRLIGLAVEELFASDFAVNVAHFSVVPADAPLSGPDLTEVIAGYVEEMTASPPRERVVARHVLLGEAHHDPELRALFDRQRASFVAFAAQTIARLGIDDSAPAAEAAVLMIESLLQRQVMIGADPLAGEQMRDLIAGHLTAWVPKRPSAILCPGCSAADP